MPQHHQPRTHAGPILTSQDEGTGGPNFEKPTEQQPPAPAPQQGGPLFEKPAAPAPPQGAPAPQGYPAPQMPAGQPMPAPPVPQGFPAAPPVPPYGAPAVGQPYPGPGPTFELAGWWSRVGAAIVDGLIIVVLAIPLVLVLVAIGALSFSDDSSGGSAALGIVSILVLGLAFIVVAFLYAPYTMNKFNGATLGKKAVGIRVVRVDGQPMDFSNSAIREIAIKQVLFNWILGTFTFGLAYLINILWPLWDAEHRALHDMLAKTRVVRG